MRILITGGAGFIGSHTADALLARGHEVRLLDNLQQPVHLKGKPKYLAPEAEFVYGDVRDPNVLLYALQGIDAVYHLAAYQDYLPDFSTYFDVNAVSTARIYELIVAHQLPVQRVIVASSQAVLGEGLYLCGEHGQTIPDIRVEAQLARGEWERRCRICQLPMTPLPTPEASINPQNQYALSKHSTESIAVSLGRRYGIPSVAMRYSIVQGPRQLNEFDRCALGQLIDLLMRPRGRPPDPPRRERRQCGCGVAHGLRPGQGHGGLHQSDVSPLPGRQSVGQRRAHHGHRQ